MAKPWVDIAVGDLDAESPVTEALMTDFFGNQEALISAQCDTRFDEVSGTDASFTKKGEVEIYIPPDVDTAAGDVTLEVRLEAKVDSATTGKIRVQLPGGTPVDSATISGTAYAFLTLTISSVDVKSFADVVILLEILIQRDSGAGSVFARCVTGSSRFERAA